MPRLTLVVLLFAVTPAFAAQNLAMTPGPAVVVRSYGLGLSAEEFTVAARIAGTILGQTGIRVSWLQCWSGSPATFQIPADCERPVRPGELIVRLVQGGDVNAAGRYTSLGFSLVDPRAGAALVGTVYIDRVGALARGARMKSADLLARAIAHEIGHLLMGTTQHATSGLMRAVWSQAELRRKAPEDWQFSKAEAQAMRRALAARHVGATVETVIADGR
jgi:hypothetical protein